VGHVAAKPSLVFQAACGEARPDADLGGCSGESEFQRVFCEHSPPLAASPFLRASCCSSTSEAHASAGFYSDSPFSFLSGVARFGRFSCLILHLNGELIWKILIFCYFFRQRETGL